MSWTQNELSLVMTFWFTGDIVPWYLYKMQDTPEQIRMQRINIVIYNMLSIIDTRKYRNKTKPCQNISYWLIYEADKYL